MTEGVLDTFKKQSSSLIPVLHAVQEKLGICQNRRCGL
jgi:hypothetical protein